MNELFGVPIIIENHLGWRTFQYRFPKSRKKRIRRKWAKKYLRRVQDPVCFEMNIPINFFDDSTAVTKTFVMNDAFFAKLKLEIEPPIAGPPTGIFWDARQLPWERAK